MDESVPHEQNVVDAVRVGDPSDSLATGNKTVDSDPATNDSDDDLPELESVDESDDDLPDLVLPSISHLPSYGQDPVRRHHRHKPVDAPTVSDLQAGERVDIMSYNVSQGKYQDYLRHLSYDVGCAYSSKLRADVAGVTPAWHSQAHESPAENLDNVWGGIGVFDGEAVEREWALRNPYFYVPREKQIRAKL
ncbi:hypothetical protein C8R43DRAFT_1121242 [Mycena crocata]|nr:hypothetical protein C8R43DRAFT_1121242 [Mycena crocata]